MRKRKLPTGKMVIATIVRTRIYRKKNYMVITMREVKTGREFKTRVRLAV